MCENSSELECLLYFLVHMCNIIFIGVGLLSIIMG
jgi:hypothetical protein